MALETGRFHILHIDEAFTMHDELPRDWDIAGSWPLYATFEFDIRRWCFLIIITLFKHYIACFKQKKLFESCIKSQAKWPLPSEVLLLFLVVVVFCFICFFSFIMDGFNTKDFIQYEWLGGFSKSILIFKSIKLSNIK